MSTPFNPAQLATYADARALREIVNKDVRFKYDILPGDDEMGPPVPVQNPNMPWIWTTPQIGIFIPKWEGGPHGDPIPSDGDKKWLHYRYQNGFEANVGLYIDKLKRYPGNADYVLGELAKEANAF